MTRANPQDTGTEGAESRVQVRQIRMRQKAEPKEYICDTLFIVHPIEMIDNEAKKFREDAMLQKAVMFLLAIVLGSVITQRLSHADRGYPTRPVRIVVSYSADGTPDAVARLLADQLTQRMKQTFFVENRPGANGTIASEIVATSLADGYVLLLASDGPIVITPLLRGGENPLMRLIPINLTGESAFVLMARPDLEVENLADVIALAKKDKLTFGSAGLGSQHHLAGELLKSRAGIDLVHVPYNKGGAEGLADLMAKRIDLMFGRIPPSLPYITAMSVKAIAVTSDTRSSILPSVPTFQEMGFPGYKVAFWVGLMAPTGTPDDVINELNNVIGAAVKSPESAAPLRRRSRSAP
jgi:tripartite-type tricarboxylate transporter receptor subunit TctC